jgi:predicted permease
MMGEDLSIVGIHDVEDSPIGDTRVTRRGDRLFFTKARLAPGVTLEQAQANASAIMARLAETYPETNEDRGAELLAASSVRVFPMIDAVLAPVAALLLGLVGLVLLIACANVANMLLARSSGRRREIAVRLALGAGRGALIRQLLVESLLLAAAGGALGLLFTVWATRFVLSLDVVAQLSLSFDLGIDVRVFGFAFAVSLLTGLAFGLLPALRASRPDLVPGLKDADGLSGSGRGITVRDALVVAQIAVSLVLLVGAALLGRSLRGAQAIELGFDADRAAMIEMQLDMIGYGDEQADAFQRQYLERVRALPGVEAAALSQRLPLTASVSVTGVFLPGVHDSPDDDGYLADEAITGPGYFEVLGIPLLEGRDFTDGDTPETPGVAIVNQTMARSYWPGESALGKRFRTGFDGDEFEIVGVVGDHKVRTVGEEPRPYVHFARTQRRSSYAIVVARTAGDPARLVATLRDELRAMEPDLGSGGSTLRESVEVSLLPVTLGARMLAAFGLLALGLASVGLYGVIAYSVSRRVREIGIRMALGADRLGVVRLVVRRGMVLAAVGVLLGGLGAALLSGLLSSVLYGVGARDPLAFGAAAALLLATALVANYLPAHRAARVDPLVALRSD